MATINKKYRELARAWHPDKNRDCIMCQERFREITLAYEMISKEVSQGRNGFRSAPVILTTRNYHKLVEMSKHLWIILVYENTQGNSFVEHVKNVFDEVALKHKQVVKFGVIDVLSQEDLLHFLPFKFQYFPNIFSYESAHSELFSKIDNLSPSSKLTFVKSDLQQFMENTFHANVQLIDHSDLKLILKNVDKEVDLSKTTIGISDLDIEVINVSSRNFVDIAVKDFAISYSGALKIYQNSMGEFDKFATEMKKYGSSRNYVLYNKIRSTKKESFFMERRIIPIPQVSKYENALGIQKVFEKIKSISFLQLYSQTYQRQCTNKRFDDSSLERDETSDVCVIYIFSKNTKVRISLARTIIF